MLNDTERRVLIDLLKLASDQFSNNGCNDYRLENTDENWALHLAVEEWANDSEDGDLRRPSNHKEPIFSNDWLLMSYFAAFLGDEAEDSDDEETPAIDSEKSAKARVALQTANGYASDALKRGDLRAAVQQIAMGAYYLGHLHVFENRQFDPTSEIENDLDDAKLHALMYRAHALVPRTPSSAAAIANAPAEMTDSEVISALDGLMAYDTGSVDSVIHDEVLRSAVKKWLRKDEKRSAELFRAFLASYLKPPYGPEDVAHAIRWLADRMDYDLA